MSIYSVRTPNKSQLLYVGNEPDLSKASAMLLKEAGFRVRLSNPFHAADAIREGRYGAIIFCATLSFAEMEQIVELAEAEQPGVPIVSLRVGLLGDAPPTSTAVVNALNGPQALISAVRSVTLVAQRAS